MKLRTLILGSIMAAGLSIGPVFAVASVHDGQAIDCFDTVAQGGIRFDPLAIGDVTAAMQTLRDDGGGMTQVVYPDDNILVISARDIDLNGDTYQFDLLGSAITAGDPKRLHESWPSPLHLTDADNDLMIPLQHVDLRHGTNAWQGGLGAGLSDNAV